MNKHITFLTLSAVALLGACSVTHDCTKGACTSCTKEMPNNRATSYFAFDSSVLSTADKDNLDHVAKRLSANPTEKVRLCGFTDNTGTATYNQELSIKRSTSAADYLESQGISPNRIKIMGYGATRFADNNATAAGRAKNRRVEVHFFK